MKQHKRSVAISHRSVTRVVDDVEVPAEIAKAVAAVPREKFARQPHGAQFWTLPSLSQGFKVAADKAVIKPHVVCYKNGIAEPFL